MKIIQKLTDRTSCEVEADSDVEIWEGLAGLQEVFGEERCGKCKKENKSVLTGHNLKFIVRLNADEDKFYELHCGDCRAKLTYSCTKKGKGLFPVRFQRKDGDYVKDENGKLVPRGDNGWTKWNFDKKVEE